MPAAPTLDIVIVNWNTGTALRECLESIAAGRAEVRLGRVAVVDNASSDGSLDAALAVPLDVDAIRNPSNLGFAAACNQGARGGRGEYVLFLNPDTRLEADTLARTIAFLEAPDRADVGICGIRLLDEGGRPSTAAARFPSLGVIVGEATGLSRIAPAVFPPHLLTAGECGETREVDQVIGAFFVIRRTLFEALDGFDERFFVYFEEVDLSLRARQAGFRSVYFAGAHAFHQGGLSSGQVKATRLFYSLRSRLLYAFKHFTATRAWMVYLVTFFLERPARMIDARRRGGTAPSETREAYARLRAFVSTPRWREDRVAQRRP